MKTVIETSRTFLLVAAVAIAFSSCKKSEDTPTTSLTDVGAVAIVSSASLVGNSTTSTDSVYAIGACNKDHKKTPVLQASLPTAISTYLTTNYAGFTFLKAFSTSLSSSTTVDAYVVAIKLNGNPIVLKFTAAGVFVKILELREGDDIRKNDGQHNDGQKGQGMFGNRDGKQRDSVALASLSTIIKAYFTTNFPKDTLKGAWMGKDASIVVISKNVTYFSTAFTSAGVLIVRQGIPSPVGKGREILQTALPAAISTYLTATYPNYVFKRAFIGEAGTVVKGYLVIIESNLTKFAITFDATGNFSAAKIIR